MICDCHMHMVLSGEDWKAAIRRHRTGIDEGWIRETLSVYRALGFTYLRDGGDRWGVGLRAKQLAGDYGIIYRSPGAPLCMQGHYGSFIGRQYATLGEYRQLIAENREAGADFVKIMISGLMDFDHAGVLTEEGLPSDTIHELVHIAHEEGLAVMAHANGARTVEAAAAAGADSVEHGAYLDADALAAMVSGGTVWVPTLSTIGNLLGKGRFSQRDVEAILAGAMENVDSFAAMGGRLAPGTDAGAWAVPHGSLTEYALLREALGEDTEAVLNSGIARIREVF